MYVEFITFDSKVGKTRQFELKIFLGSGQIPSEISCFLHEIFEPCDSCNTMQIDKNRRIQEIQFSVLDANTKMYVFKMQCI